MSLLTGTPENIKPEAKESNVILETPLPDSLSSNLF